MKRFIVILLLLIVPVNVFAYEVNVHEKITENATSSSNVDNYLGKNLNISIHTVFDGKEVIKWLKDGSNWEDNDPRWLSHYYDAKTGRGLNKYEVDYELTPLVRP